MAAASTHLQIVQAVQAAIVALALSGYTVYAEKMQRGREASWSLPAIVCAPIGTETYPETGTNVADDTGFPVLVAFIHATNQDPTLIDNELLTRQKVRKLFRNKHLTIADGTLYVCKLEPGFTIDPALWFNNNLSVGTFTVRALCREVRS